MTMEVAHAIASGISFGLIVLDVICGLVFALSMKKFWTETGFVSMCAAAVITVVLVISGSVWITTLPK